MNCIVKTECLLFYWSRWNHVLKGMTQIRIRKGVVKEFGFCQSYFITPLKFQERHSCDVTMYVRVVSL